jgi:hypothetical protein
MERSAARQANFPGGALLKIQHDSHFRIVARMAYALKTRLIFTLKPDF